HDDKVAVYSRNTIEAVESMVAIFKIRGVMVNINYRYVPAELEYLLNNDDIYMLYTGGTTGAPKGVMWRQEDVFMVLGGGIDFLTGEKVTSEWELADKAVDGGVLVRAALPPLIHGGAQWAILMALFAGHTSVLVPEFDA